MKALTTLLLVLGLAGCGSTGSVVSNDSLTIDTDVRFSDTELLGLHQEFTAITGFRQQVNIRYQVAGESFSGRVIGVCFPSSNLIVISGEIRTRADIIKKWVVYHELIHCTLNIGHSDNPKSLMFPSITSEGIQGLLENEEQIINFSIEESL